jgi:hypothetical protein
MSASVRPSEIVPARPKHCIRVADLEYHLLSPRAAGHPLLAHAYEVWRDGWAGTLREVAGMARIDSDDFIRQDEIGILSLAGECVSLTALRWCDLTLPMSAEDSYFRSWPALAMDRIARSVVCISSNSLLVPEWRGALVEDASGAQMQLKLVMLGLTVQRFLSSTAHYIVGVSRNDRSMNRVAKELGLASIAQLEVHGIESDIMLADKSTARAPRIPVEELWNRRRAVLTQPPHLGDALQSRPQNETPDTEPPIVLHATHSVRNRSSHAWRPLLLDAAEAHRTGAVTYDASGTVTLRHAALGGGVVVTTAQQYPCVLPTFLALDKALSSASNSPRGDSGQSLREAFDQEYQAYLAQMTERTGSAWEPDYGTYVYDRKTGDLYLIAPEYWHRLALLTSNAKLSTDPAGELSAAQIRTRLESAVIGFVGASLGSNLIEGVVREMRPRAAKLADPDYLEPTNLNRFQHGSLRYLSQARSRRNDAKNGFETLFVNKALLVAYENQLVDPYTDWYVYEEGIQRDNLDQFLLGDANEPRLDYVVEEADDIRVKIEVRKRARQYGIPVFMASDVGHRAQVQMQDYAAYPAAPLGYRIPDQELLQRLDRCMASGARGDLFRLVEGLIGANFAVDEYADWIEQRGEQPTSSIPQSGSVAQLSGALGGKLLTLHRLGHPLRERVIFDMRRLELILE